MGVGASSHKASFLALSVIYGCEKSTVERSEFLYETKYLTDILTKPLSKMALTICQLTLHR